MPLDHPCGRIHDAAEWASACKIIEIGKAAINLINTRSSVHPSLAWQRTEVLPLGACPLAGLPTGMEEKAHGRLQGKQPFFAARTGPIQPPTPRTIALHNRSGRICHATTLGRQYQTEGFQ